MRFDVNSTPAYAGRQRPRQWADSWLPSRCCLCGVSTRHRHGLCRSCDRALPYMDPAVCCRQCGAALRPQSKSNGPSLPSLCFDPRLCPICDYEGHAIDRLVSLFHYRSPLDMWIPQLKFHGNLSIARLLGELFVRRYTGPRPDVLVPLPLHRARLAERGYDQPLELCRPIAEQLQLRLCSDLLERRRATRRQSEMDIEQRAANLKGAFSVNMATFNDMKPRFVAIFDDVFTTGATVNEAAMSLLDAGVERVEAWVIAHAD